MPFTSTTTWVGSASISLPWRNVIIPQHNQFVCPTAEFPKSERNPTSEIRNKPRPDAVHGRLDKLRSGSRDSDFLRASKLGSRNSYSLWRGQIVASLFLRVGQRECESVGGVGFGRFRQVEEA